MQVDRARKEALIEELKHYINGKFAEFEKKFNADLKKETATLKKAVREKAVRGE